MMRPLLATELAAMTGVLTEAFMADPLYRALAPSPRARQRWLRWVMELSLRVSHRFGGALCLAHAPAAGCICLVPPGHNPLSLLEYLRAAPGMPPIGSGVRAWIWPGIGMKQLLHATHYPGPHYYVLAVGVAPAEQGKGVGGTLLRSALRLAAERGVPSYLETASPRNVELYRHLGFRVHRELAPRRLPPIWTMLCPAARPTRLRPVAAPT